MTLTHQTHQHGFCFFTPLQDFTYAATKRINKVSNELGISLLLWELDCFQREIIYFCIKRPWATLPVVILDYIFLAPVHIAVFVVGQTIALVGAIFDFLSEKLGCVKDQELSLPLLKNTLLPQ